MFGGRFRSTGQAGAPGPNLLDMTPVREARWEEDAEGVVTVVRERPPLRGLRSLGGRVAFLMAPPRIRLDEVGSYAWIHMDGRTDVRELASLVHAEFGEQVEPVNQRLGHFVRLLKRERFIRYADGSGG